MTTVRHLRFITPKQSSIKGPFINRGDCPLVLFDFLNCFTELLLVMFDLESNMKADTNVDRPDEFVTM